MSIGCWLLAAAWFATIFALLYQLRQNGKLESENLRLEGAESACHHLHKAGQDGMLVRCLCGMHATPAVLRFPSGHSTLYCSGETRT